MPVHDWTRVSEDVFHDFQLAWYVHLSTSLNTGVLPRGWYSLTEFKFDPDTVEEADAPYQRLDRRIVIHKAADDGTVAAVEIVSPHHKSSQTRLKLFCETCAELLKHGVALTVVDLHPPQTLVPHGIHAEIWRTVVDDSGVVPDARPFTVVSYNSGHQPLTAYVEPVEISELLPEMPLFLDAEKYVNLPLESSYMRAIRGMAKHWRNILEQS